MGASLKSALYKLFFTLIFGTACCLHGEALAHSPVVEVEEAVYEYRHARNGADPLWNYGSTNIVRIGNDVYASGLETLDADPPLNNTTCTLWKRGDNGWQRIFAKPDERTREPCPLVAQPLDNAVYMSLNSTSNPKRVAGGGPAVPKILEFSLVKQQDDPVEIVPLWEASGSSPSFTEHSYRSFATDSKHGGAILFQNIAHSHAEWAFRERNGVWVAQGRLFWPALDESNRLNRTRVCYPNVAVRNRAVHFVGVSDVVEPNEAWRNYKFERSGRRWDYVFRRLVYTQNDDVVNSKFIRWIEIQSVEATAGQIIPGDLWVAPDGSAHIVWEESSLDVRLRDKFFPEAKQRRSMNYAVVRNGAVESRRTLLANDEGEPGPIPHLPRFHLMPDGRLLIFFYVSGTDASTKPLSENRIIELREDGSIAAMTVVPLSRPLDRYMTATVRAGSLPSQTLDLLGTVPSQRNTIRYARVRLD